MESDKKGGGMLSVLDKFWYSGIDTSVVWTRKTSKFASISIGVRHDSPSSPPFFRVKKKNGTASFPQKSGYGCLSWLFRIQRGDFNLDIPISFIGNTSLDATKGVGGYGGLVTYVMQSLYLGLVSFLIDEAIGDLFGPNGRLMNRMVGDKDSTTKEDEKQLRKEQGLLRSHSNKAREDAERQALLMSRQASIKKRAEEKKDGLVIVKAIYMIGADKFETKESERRSVTLDVTTQLQFWVVDSKLELPSSSKSQMLGFYDLTVEYLDDLIDYDSFGEKGKGQESGDKKYFFSVNSFKTWWQTYWNDPNSKKRSLHKTMMERKCVPILNVEYKLGSQLYRIVVRDDEPLILPNATATFIGT